MVQSRHDTLRLQATGSLMVVIWAHFTRGNVAKASIALRNDSVMDSACINCFSTHACVSLHLKLESQFVRYWYRVIVNKQRRPTDVMGGASSILANCLTVVKLPPNKSHHQCQWRNVTRPALHGSCRPSWLSGYVATKWQVLHFQTETSIWLLLILLLR